MVNSREIAMEILVDIHRNNAYSNKSIDKHLNKSISYQDENLIRELVYGVLENKIYIDYILSKASKIKIKKIHFQIIEILRTGIYQILFMDKIPESAAVNEAVKLAKKYGHKGTIGFVNGVLRSIVRDKEKFMEVDEKDKIKYISIKYSHPEYMVKRWIEEYGVEFTEDLCRSNNEKPLLNIRVNTLKISKEELTQRLTAQGLNIVEGKYANDCLIIQNPTRITDIDEFKEGLFTIQDESSILVGQIINPEENSTILDICAAPGGKSTHLGQLMNNTGKIISRDIYSHKIDLIKENVKRLGIKNIEVEIHDALNLDKELINKIDYCLVDAPCSGLGLIRRKPEIKFNRSESDIVDLIQLQKSIVNIAKEYVKIGGILIYSTCTIENKENILLIQEFLNKNPNFKLLGFEDNFQNTEDLKTLDRGYIQLYPNIHGTDGFFIAKMIRQV